jgi:hypothetical protein
LRLSQKRGIKQLDNSIDDTFVSSGRKAVQGAVK